MHHRRKALVDLVVENLRLVKGRFRKAAALILGQNITETLVIAAQLAPADFVLLAGGGEHQMDVFEYVHDVSFRGGCG